jgi:hypothetical protein
MLIKSIATDKFIDPITAARTVTTATASDKNDETCYEVMEAARQAVYSREQAELCLETVKRNAERALDQIGRAPDHAVSLNSLGEIQASGPAADVAVAKACWELDRLGSWMIKRFPDQFTGS